LRPGDLIVAVDGQPVDDTDAFGFRFAIKPIGGSAQIGVMRAGKEVKVAIPLEAAPENPPRDPVKVRGRSPLLGATLVNLSPAVADEMRLDGNLQGVVVTDVDTGTPAQMLGLQPGDVLLELNGEKVTRTRDLDKLTQTPQRIWRVQISRGGQMMTTVVGG
jgi:S1-C subfamily serine protease